MEQNTILKILKILETKVLIVVYWGLGIVVIEIILRFFSIDTNQYFLFSGQIHLLIITYLIIIYFYSKSLSTQIEAETEEMESILSGFVKMFLFWFFVGITIVLHSKFGEQEGLMLFHEGDKALIIKEHFLEVVSMNDFYKYKDYENMLFLVPLLVFYFLFLLPVAKKIKGRK